MGSPGRLYSAALCLLTATLPLAAQQNVPAPNDGPAGPRSVPLQGSYPAGVPAPAPTPQTTYSVAPGDTFPLPPSKCEGAPAVFTPYMLGDFAALVNNLASDIKIAEGESPRPVDRAFYKFNYYNNISKDRFDNDPTQPLHNIDLYRQVVGFEKTFMDGQVSLGLRVPFNTLVGEGKAAFVTPTAAGPVVTIGPPSETSTEFGNVTAVFKGVLWEDKASGSLLSAGATLTLPTATSRKTEPGPSTMVYVQPFGAFILRQGDFFLQGFTSITAPVIHVESIILFNDLGVGYFIYHDRSGSGLIKSVAPTVEVHVNTPLRQPTPVLEAGFIDNLLLSDTVDLTMGGTVELWNGMTLGAAFVLPLTAPKPFDYEVLAQLNYRF